MATYQDILNGDIAITPATQIIYKGKRYRGPVEIEQVMREIRTEKGDQGVAETPVIDGDNPLIVDAEPVHTTNEVESTSNDGKAVKSASKKRRKTSGKSAE